MTPNQSNYLRKIARHLRSYPASVGFEIKAKVIPGLTAEASLTAAERLDALAGTEDGWLAHRVISAYESGDGYPCGLPQVVELVVIGPEAFAFANAAKETIKAALPC
jgi:hypothetical protein